MGGSKVRGSVGAKGGHLGAVPPLAVINAPPTTGHYFIYFPDNDRRSIHYPLYYTGLLNAVERSVHLHGSFTTSGQV